MLTKVHRTEIDKNVFFTVFLSGSTRILANRQRVCQLFVEFQFLNRPNREAFSSQLATYLHYLSIRTTHAHTTQFEQW